MAISVPIYINDTLIDVVSAVCFNRSKGTDPDSLCDYHLYKMGQKIGEIHNHRYGDGAHSLAMKMLERAHPGEYNALGRRRKLGRGRGS